MIAFVLLKNPQAHFQSFREEAEFHRLNLLHSICPWFTIFPPYTSGMIHSQPVNLQLSLHGADPSETRLSSGLIFPSLSSLHAPFEAGRQACRKVSPQSNKFLRCNKIKRGRSYCIIDKSHWAPLQTQRKLNPF